MTQAVANVIETNCQAGSVAHPGVTFDARNISDRIRLEPANPMGRRVCRVNYTSTAYWTLDQHEVALRVAGHRCFFGPEWLE